MLRGGADFPDFDAYRGFVDEVVGRAAGVPALESVCPQFLSLLQSPSTKPFSGWLSAPEKPIFGMGFPPGP